MEIIVSVLVVMLFIVILVSFAIMRRTSSRSNKVTWRSSWF
ncbi:hypothetical protein CPL00136_CDS0160 [Salmonella phage vB_SenS-3]